MIKDAKSSAGAMAVVMRFVGWLFMFIGLSGILGPFGALLDFIPVLGSIGRFATKAIAFVIASVLSTVTVVIGMIAHNPIALGVVVLGALGGTGYIINKARKKQKQAGAGASVANLNAQQNNSNVDNQRKAG